MPPYFCSSSYNSFGASNIYHNHDSLFWFDRCVLIWWNYYGHSDSKLGLNQRVILRHLSLFGVCTAICILSGLWQKWFFSLVCGIFSDYIWVILGFVRFALSCLFLLICAAIVYRALNYSFHGVAVSIRLCWGSYMSIDIFNSVPFPRGCLFSGKAIVVWKIFGKDNIFLQVCIMFCCNEVFNPDTSFFND